MQMAQRYAESCSGTYFVSLEEDRRSMTPEASHRSLMSDHLMRFGIYLVILQWLNQFGQDP